MRVATGRELLSKMYKAGAIAPALYIFGKKTGNANAAICQTARQKHCNGKRCTLGEGTNISALPRTPSGAFRHPFIGFSIIQTHEGGKRFSLFVDFSKKFFQTRHVPQFHGFQTGGTPLLPAACGSCAARRWRGTPPVCDRGNGGCEHRPTSHKGPAAFASMDKGETRLFGKKQTAGRVFLACGPHPASFVSLAGRLFLRQKTAWLQWRKGMGAGKAATGRWTNACRWRSAPVAVPAAAGRVVSCLPRLPRVLPKSSITHR